MVPKNEKNPLSVLKVSHLPDGLNELTIRNYFRQFGFVGDIYLPRSQRSLRSRGLAFISMPTNIAEIAASTLQDKLMFNKLIKCEVIVDPHKNTFTRKPLWRETLVQRTRKQAAAAEHKPTSKRTKIKRKRNLLKNIEALKKDDPHYQFKISD